MKLISIIALLILVPNESMLHEQKYISANEYGSSIKLSFQGKKRNLDVPIMSEHSGLDDYRNLNLNHSTILKNDRRLKGKTTKGFKGKGHKTKGYKGKDYTKRGYKGKNYKIKNKKGYGYKTKNYKGKNYKGKGHKIKYKKGYDQKGYHFKGKGYKGSEGYGYKGKGYKGSKGYVYKGKGYKGSNGYGYKEKGYKGSKGYAYKGKGNKGYGYKGYGFKGSKGYGLKGSKGYGYKGKGYKGSKGYGYKWKGNKGYGLKGYGFKGSKGYGLKGKGYKGSEGYGFKGSKGYGFKGSKGYGFKGKGYKGKGYKMYPNKGYGYKGKGYKGPTFSYYDYYNYGKGSNYYGVGKGGYYYYYVKGKGKGIGKGKGPDIGKGKAPDIGKGKGHDYYGTGKGVDDGYYNGEGGNRESPPSEKNINRPASAPASNEKGKFAGNNKATKSKIQDKSKIGKDSKNPVGKSEIGKDSKNVGKSNIGKASKNPVGKDLKDNNPKGKKPNGKNPKGDNLSQVETIECRKEGYNGYTDKKPVRFKYAVQATSTANINNIISQLETKIANMIATSVCQPTPITQRNLQISSIMSSNRRLAVIGVDSRPQDILEKSNYCVENTSCCDNNCHLVSGDMTLITDGENSETEICLVLSNIETYINELGPGAIVGMVNAFFSSSDNVICLMDDSNESRLFPIQNQIIAEDYKDDDIFHKLFWPLLVLVLLLICCCCYIRMNRKTVDCYDDDFKDDENRLSMSSVAGDIIDDGGDTFSMTSTKYREKARFLNSVDVHKCNSLACNICRQSGGTRFVRSTSQSFLTGSCNKCNEIS